MFPVRTNYITGIIALFRQKGLHRSLEPPVHFNLKLETQEPFYTTLANVRIIINVIKLKSKKYFEYLTQQYDSKELRILRKE